MQMVYNSVNAWWGAGEKHDKNLLVTVYFDLPVVHLMAIFRNIEYITSNERVISDLERIWKEVVMA
jgi:hypothetical protein